MHQQVRCSIRTSLRDGTRDMADEESLREILDLLKVKNLRSAARIQRDGNDEFVFSVHHRKDDDKPDEEARDLLLSANYEARICKPSHFLVTDKEGALLEYIDEVESKSGERVIEVHILSSEPNRKVPVQLVTPRDLNR